MEAFGKLMCTILFGAAAVASRAWALVILWRWFVVPTFHLPSLTWALAYGLVLVVEVLHSTALPEYADKSYTGQLGRTIGGGILTPWLCVFIGWIIK